MPYRRNPFNPLTPAPNQVVNELNQANENFDILAQTFLYNDPETRTVIDAVNSRRSLEANRLQGYTPSQMPSPNTIPVALSNGRLDIGWVSYRTSLTNATSDYSLEIGEEAYYVWNTTRSTSLPLRIAVNGWLYELIILVPNRVAYPVNIFLLPNNLTYQSAFQRTVMYPNNSDGAVFNFKDNPSVIFYEQVGGGGMLVSWLQTTTGNKGEMHHMTVQHSGLNFSSHMQGAHRWNNTTTVWSSLGTLTIGASHGLIDVSVRRLL